MSAWVAVPLIWLGILALLLFLRVGRAVETLLVFSIAASYVVVVAAALKVLGA